MDKTRPGEGIELTIMQTKTYMYGISRHRSIFYFLYPAVDFYIKLSDVDSYIEPKILSIFKHSEPSSAEKIRRYVQKKTSEVVNSAGECL